METYLHSNKIVSHLIKLKSYFQIFFALMNDIMNLEGLVFGQNFVINHKIGSGSFGVVFEGRDLRNQKKVAIKFEKLKAPNPQLKFEMLVYRRLNGESGFPKMLWSGTQHGYNILVLELLSNNLEKQFTLNSSKPFTLKTIAMLGIQMLNLLKLFHDRNYVHRDVKPDNFVFHSDGLKLCLLDFGLAKTYRNTRTKEHISFATNVPLCGTARYASINALMYNEQSRRDDLESLAYILIYLSKGRLPWQGLAAQTPEEKIRKIVDMKSSIPVEEICSGLPKQFPLFLSYTRQLEFSQDPDYLYLKGLLLDILKENELCFDYHYDWLRDPPKIPNRLIHNEYLSIQYEKQLPQLNSTKKFNKVSLVQKTVRNSIEAKLLHANHLTRKYALK